MKYHFTVDPGHGWLAVTRAEINALGIADKISSYSYQKGEIVFLEEDADLSTFLRAKEARREPVEYIERHVDETPIRNYRSYSPK